jgi:hypothetical protein
VNFLRVTARSVTMWLLRALLRRSPSLLIGPTMKATLSFAVVAAAGAAALALAPSAAAVPEDDFLDAIASNGITWEPADTPAVLDTGQAVCTDWTNGVSFSQEVAELVSATGWTLEQAGAFVGAATGAFCPRYMNLIG